MERISGFLGELVFVGVGFVGAEVDDGFDVVVVSKFFGGCGREFAGAIDAASADDAEVFGPEVWSDGRAKEPYEGGAQNDPGKDACVRGLRGSVHDCSGRVLVSGIR